MLEKFIKNDKIITIHIRSLDVDKRKSLVSGNVLPVIIKFTIPILLSLLLQIAYGTADLFIVSKFSDTANVSGVSVGSQISQIFTNFCVGLSMGATVLIGRYIGSGEKEKATKVVGSSIIIFAGIALIVTCVILTFSRQFTTLMNTPEESFEIANSYLFIAGLGSVFIVFYNLLGSIFRGIGDSKTPLVTVAIACVFNIVLDIVLVGGFSMGASGAAVATVCAQGLSVLLSLFIIKKKGLPFEFSKKDIKICKTTAKQSIKIGFPTSLQMVLTSFSFLVISSLLNALGLSASAAVGVVSKITAVILVVPQAFMQSLSAFTAQNVGAGKAERANKALFYAISIGLAYGIITGYLSYFHGTLFTNLFGLDEETTLCALDYLKAYSPDCLLVAFIFSLSGYLNGLGRTPFVMAQNIFGAFCIRIPVSYYFSTLANPSLFLIGLAVPISSAMQILIVVTYLKLIKNKQQNL